MGSYSRRWRFSQSAPCESQTHYDLITFTFNFFFHMVVEMGPLGFSDVSNTGQLDKSHTRPVDGYCFRVAPRWSSQRTWKQRYDPWPLTVAAAAGKLGAGDPWRLELAVATPRTWWETQLSKWPHLNNHITLQKFASLQIKLQSIFKSWRNYRVHKTTLLFHSINLNTMTEHMVVKLLPFPSLQTKLRGLSPRTNCTDWATAAFRRS
jgi:hypothetical protein